MPGSVAKSTHAGIPWLRFIRQRLGQPVHFWPFDGWEIPPGRSAIAEVYPAWLSRADRDGSLAAFLKPDLSPPERTQAQVEAGYWAFPA